MERKNKSDKSFGSPRRAEPKFGAGRNRHSGNRESMEDRRATPLEEQHRKRMDRVRGSRTKHEND